MNFASFIWIIVCGGVAGLSVDKHAIGVALSFSISAFAIAVNEICIAIRRINQ